MRYASYTSSGLISTVGVGIPPSTEPYIEVSDNEYLDVLENIALRQVINGAIEVYTPPESEQLSTAQTTQTNLIKSAFTAAANANVTDSSGIIWEGGISSGNSIFLGCQLAQQAGATITLYDAAKAPHSMTIAEGMAVAALIGATYQAALGTKNRLYAQITAATSVSAVQSIVWP